MKINIEHIQAIVERYGIYDTVCTVSPYIEYYGIDSTPREVKIVARVEFISHPPVIVKISKEENHTTQNIEEQSVFSEYLREHGILTAKRYKTENTYCTSYELQQLAMNVTVEDYLGNEIKVIDCDTAFHIGTLMGRMHTISEKGSCHIHANTIFNLVGYDEVNGYDTLKAFADKGTINSEMFCEIDLLYQERLSKALNIWNELPRFATQGDISINNLSECGNDIAIFDFNIAGDETLVSDMIIEGLLTTYEMELKKDYNEKSRFNIFLDFVKGYMSIRKLTKKEQQAANHILAVSDALWFSRIKYNDSSIENLINQNNEVGINKILCTIKEKLMHDYSNIFVQ
jgi:Ser/Thr protein kinase RdoA (MazF antagonist)